MKNYPEPAHGQITLQLEKVRKFRAASRASETKRALQKNWQAFEEWCRLSGGSPYPCSPEVLESYLVYLAESGKRSGTIAQAKWAIDSRHKLSGVQAPGESERVRIVLAGIKRTLGSRQNRKAALTIDHLRQITFSDDLSGKRDKALLLTGFAGGFRRSELARLRVEELEFLPDSLRIFLERSKTDQEGKGVWVDIVRAVDPACCPVESLLDWLSTAGIKSGAVFRSVDRWVALGDGLSTVTIGKIVKKAAAACGLDPTRFGGHSLRAGCATYLLEKGVPLNVVAKQGRWKKSDTVLRYDRGGTITALKGLY